MTATHQSVAAYYKIVKILCRYYKILLLCIEDVVINQAPSSYLAQRLPSSSESF